MIFFFDLCRYCCRSNVNRKLDSQWKGCRFRYNIKEPLIFSLLAQADILGKKMVIKKNDGTHHLGKLIFMWKVIYQFTRMDGQIEVNSQDKTLFFPEQLLVKNSVHVRNKSSIHCFLSSAKLSLFTAPYM